MQRSIAAAAAAFAVTVTVGAVHAQDIRGLEVCTAEKSMERRTSCLQSNVEFLQQALVKQARDTETKLAAAARESKAQRQEIAALTAELASLRAELAAMKKPERSKDRK
jgi:hypothetical protein